MKHERFNISEYFGYLRDSKVLDEIAEFSRMFHEAAMPRI